MYAVIAFLCSVFTMCPMRYFVGPHFRLPCIPAVDIEMKISNIAAFLECNLYSRIINEMTAY